MVGVSDALLVNVSVLLGQQGQTVLEQLEPATRVKLLAAFAGLIILGFALVLLTWLAGRAARRYMNSGAPERDPIPENDWTKRPL